MYVNYYFGLFDLIFFSILGVYLQGPVCKWWSGFEWRVLWPCLGQSRRVKGLHQPRIQRAYKKDHLLIPNKEIKLYFNVVTVCLVESFTNGLTLTEEMWIGEFYCIKTKVFLLNLYIFILKFSVKQSRMSVQVLTLKLAFVHRLTWIWGVWQTYFKSELAQSRTKSNVCRYKFFTDCQTESQVEFKLELAWTCITVWSSRA